MHWTTLRCVLPFISRGWVMESWQTTGTIMDGTNAWRPVCAWHFGMIEFDYWCWILAVWHDIFFNLNGILVNRIYNNYIDSIHTTYKCLDQKTKQNLTSQMPLASVDISTITNGSTVDGCIQMKRCWGSSDTGIKVQFVNVYSTPPYSGWSSIRLDNA